MPLVLPDLPPELPRRGSRPAAALGRLVLRVLGWSVAGNFPARTKMVVIVAHHTSAWDLVVGLAAKLALRLDARYLAKHTLFRWPLGPILRHTGAIPVDRRSRHGVVEQMVREFERRSHLLLALSPEGTRQRVESWRSGFYHIADSASVPIVPVGLDFGSRQVRIGPALEPTGNEAADVAELRRFFADIEARHPELASPG